MSNLTEEEREVVIKALESYPAGMEEYSWFRAPYLFSCKALSYNPQDLAAKLRAA